MSIIEIMADFVLKVPCEFMVEMRAVWVVFKTLVADQLYATLDPMPPDIRSLNAIKFNRDIVGHVPSRNAPDMVGSRLELCDPVPELSHLKKFAVFLHLHRAHP